MYIYNYIYIYIYVYIYMYVYTSSWGLPTSIGQLLTSVVVVATPPPAPKLNEGPWPCRRWPSGAQYPASKLVWLGWFGWLGWLG